MSEFLGKNGITIDDNAYSYDFPCCHELWDRETEGLKPCGDTPTREVKRGRFVCEKHDILGVR